MTRGTDWYQFHARIDPIDTVDALQTALADPTQRWYGLRRIAAVAATGALVAASWNPNLHPRGRDGKFIEKFGWVRWFDAGTLKWRTGWVSDIDGGNGAITVRAGGDKVEFPNAKNLYSRPKPKALLDLPDPVAGTVPDKFVKISGQGGSNPGALYQIDGSFADGPPDLTKNSKTFSMFGSLRQPGTFTHLGDSVDASSQAEAAVPTEIDVIQVPRIDGTLDRYDVLQRFGNHWYRVPASGPMTIDDTMRPELQVTANDAFGEPGSARRHRVIADLGTVGITRGSPFDVEDTADMVQQIASPLPGAGDKYYVKKMNVPERARSEALANDFYELLGVPVPEVAVGADGTTISSKLVGDTIAFNPNNPQHVAAAQDGYVGDAWLANWDVIGMGFDNVQIDSDGRAWRIDAGGALEYRAKGTPKGAMFGDMVGEMASLQNPKLNPTAAKVFGGITTDRLIDQATVLQSISPADIQNLADSHDMGHVGPVLIARRKNILDQLGIIDPPIEIEPVPTPATVKVPVKAVTQLGEPPTVAVHNYTLSIDALPASTLQDTDWDDPEYPANSVFRRDGDLWVIDGPVSTTTSDGHAALFRNLFTDERRQLVVYDGEDEFLDTYTVGNVDTLIDNATPTRDLAVSEIVNRTTGTPLAGLATWNVNQDGDPEGMRYGSTGISNWATLQGHLERGRLGKDNDRPLMDAAGDLWEITHVPTGDDDHIGLTKRTGDNSGVTADLDKNTWNATGTWRIGNNDTTALIWKSKYDTPLEGDQDSDGVSLDQQSKIAAWEDSLGMGGPGLGPDGGLNIPGDDGVSDAVGLPDDETPEGMQKVFDDTLGIPIYIPSNKVDAWMAGTWKPGDTDAATAAAAPTSNQKIVHGVVASLSPSEPLLSTEMALTDLDQLKADLLGKHVITLPIAAHDNPDWPGTNLGTANGIGTVTSVESKKAWDYTSSPAKIVEVVALKVEKPYGGFSWVVAGDQAKWKKVVIPVETAPAAQHVTFKKNGDIFINGEKVGTHTGYGGVIDGDHSLTGTPLEFGAAKQQAAKNAASSLVVPIVPKPTKPKSTKVHATEQEIKDLNQTLSWTASSIIAKQQEIEHASKAEATAAGEGNPLNDGSKPVKGDWVFSTKDGTYAQVLNPNVVGFAGKGVLSPDMIKVKIQDPVTGKWKQSNRKREQLVSVAGPGEAPFVFQTKALQAQSGAWFGPGSQVTVEGGGGKVTVLDTTTDGKVKILAGDGSHYWTPAMQVIGTAAGTGGSVKTLGGGPSINVDILNAELSVLQDEHAQLAATIANTVLATPGKKKKPIGTPFPGPGGLTFKQPAWLAEGREAKGLKNTKDGFVPTPGMILRHNDGTQYVVWSMGEEGTSHKNSVYVAPVGSTWDYKWRAVSTMTVDHEAMLTDENGEAVPVISTVDGADWSPESGLVLAKTYTKGYYVTDPKTGHQEYRKKEMVRYYIVGYDGTVYNADGSKASSGAIQPGQPIRRIGYLDKSSQGGKKLTVSVQPHHNAQVGQVEYVVIHDPATPAGVPLGNQNAPVASPPPAPPVPTPAAPEPITPELAPEPTPPTPAPPVAPPSNIPTTVSPTPTDELPVFTGSNLAGMEVPHPPTTSSAKAVPAFQAQGGDPTLDVAGLAGAHSVTAAIAQTIDVVKQNKKDGTKKWVGTYGIADHDTIEDMMVRTQAVTDAQGVEYVEVSFRLEKPAARKAHTTFMTSAKNEAGDWESINRNATNLVPGDVMAARVASGGGVAPKGALRPDENGTVPNVTVIAAPVLIGKNKAGTLDVYRTQVISAGGDIGFLDLEDRNGEDTVVIFQWDATKPRTTNSVKSLNPNAKDQGWSVKTNTLSWASTGGWQKLDILPDGSKKAPTTTVTSAPYSGSDSGGVEFGAGTVVQRDVNGVHIEYATSAVKNALDGQTVIRVRADDPDAQRKISEAMELVGVTKKAQEPPTKAALTQMAADKVYEQFNATYTRGMKANGGLPDALTAIDKAVGEHMPNKRKATADDISLRLTKDGRVQVLVSEDVAKAVVAKNGVKQYVHKFMGTDKLNMLESILSGESPTLMATTERFQHGVWYTGMSSGKDHKHDSADHLFIYMDKTGHVTSSGSATIDAVTLHRHVDYYFQPGDTYGERQSNQLNWLNGPSGGELMMQRRFEADLISYVRLSDHERDVLIKKLNKRGVFNAPNGRPLEEYLVVNAPPKQPVNFGDEITLGSLPDDASVAPTLVTV